MLSPSEGGDEGSDEGGDTPGELAHQQIRRSRSHTKNSLLSDGTYGTCAEEEPDELSGWLETKSTVGWKKQPRWFELRSGVITCHRTGGDWPSVRSGRCCASAREAARQRRGRACAP